ncbi:hypothetical protein [Rhodococcus sp. BS-15]|uniref:hypothetical protein n=1 Tax=Rhodococcus sp. BS-15 TaxID=1304954 RepID=UPI000AAE257D|nr:hypothetical protein [Rhodococcus sp. BS-15]
MGYEATSGGTLYVPVAAADAIWVELIERYPNAEDYVEGCVEELASVDKIASAVAGELGSYDPTSGYSVTRVEQSCQVSVWGSGKLGSPELYLQVLAEHGATGEIHGAGEDSAMWRWKLADGGLSDDGGRMVYGEDVDPSAWVAQLASGVGAYDRIAVTSSEQAAHDQITAWCREIVLAEAPTPLPETELDAVAVATRAAELGIRGRVIPAASGREELAGID